MKFVLRYLLCIFLVSYSCNGKIKNDKSNIVVEKGTEILDDDTTKNTLSTTKNNVDSTNFLSKVSPVKIPSDIKKDSILGFWVGFFEKDENRYSNDEDLFVDDGYEWRRENKINISIDKINDSIIIGHSVVAGNNRPFKGYYNSLTKSFIAKEPGDDKYDGKFIFKFNKNKLIGTWQAYGDIKIKYRQYELSKVYFNYDPNINLERAKRYINWNKSISNKETIEYDENDTEEWIRNEFSTASEIIYEVNASNTLLKKEDLENLKKGDLTIIRNTIYARHGYSFKNRPLRVFFDAQSWYIPVHNNIKNNFTELEKKNIKLLLSFEKNADEYYDYFGRG
ncbi:YARHG domain-containing protein [Tenacibaculum sp. 190524A05c]|uniref:YARHG domain-containing protein n=1 Tax=Tenacibaculum platacis TaxID=3137852 RepID=UPI0031FA749B